MFMLGLVEQVSILTAAPAVRAKSVEEERVAAQELGPKALAVAAP
jgi:hypothetical protein